MPQRATAQSGQIPASYPSEKTTPPPNPRRTRDEDEDEDEDRPRSKKKKNPHAGTHYKVAAGLTSIRGVHEDGEIVTHEEMGPGFDPIDPKIQMDKYGRVMYQKHDPTPDELRRLSLARGAVKTTPPRLEEEDEEEEFEPQEEEVQDSKDLKDLNDDELWTMAIAEGLDFPRETPRERVQGALAKKMQERDAEAARLAKENQ
jgi:hypothetical protein